MAVVERLTLEAVSAHTPEACQHLHRYELAAELCDGLNVLDLACGSGYGAAILRRRAAAVVGVDRDAATVDAANATIGRSADVAFEVADAAEYLRRPDARRFDAIVCFEGLEHFHELDDCLASLRRLADAGARLVLSVPNSAALGEENEFHRTDFDLALVESKLATLGDATVLYQYLAEGSLIQGRETGELEASALEPERGEPEWANNFVVLVNFEAAALPVGASARSYLAVAPNYTRYMIGLERANQELWRVNARLGRERLGRFDTAAVAARLRESSALDEANARAAAAEERARAAEERAAAAEAALARKGAGPRARLGRVVRERLARGRPPARD
ncbi:MAG: class I SAM-dependent methyltransferase [Thermoleophilaceae bacterium]